MKQATNLIDGSYAKTLGYYDINDDGGAIYYISESQPDGYYEILNNGLYAKLLELQEMCPEMLGAKANGINDDYSYINNLLNNFNNIKFNNKIYAISHGITITNKHINFNECTLKRLNNGFIIDFSNSQNLNLENFKLMDNGNSYGNALIGKNCENITLSDFSIILTSPHNNEIGNWATCLSGKNFKMSNFHIDTLESGLWADGLHFGYIENLEVNNFEIFSGDDAIALCQHNQGGTDFINKSSKNIHFSNGTIRSLTNVFRIGFDNSSLEEQINNINYEDVTFNNINSKGKFFIRNEYLNHNLQINPKSNKNIKFLNVNYENIGNLESSNYAHIFSSNEYNLENFIFENCKIKINEEQTTARNMIFLGNDLKNGELTFLNCNIDTNILNLSYSINITDLNIINCIIKSNGKSISTNANSNIKCLNSYIKNYGDLINNVFDITSSSSTIIIKNSIIDNYSRITPTNSSIICINSNNIFTNNINSLTNFTDNNYFNDIITGSRIFQSSDKMIIYISASSSKNIDLSKYTVAEISLLKSNIEHKDIYYNIGSNYIYETSANQNLISQFLSDNNISLDFNNKILTITNNNNSSILLKISLYSQVN